jgi:hypothetical protein
MTEGPRLHAELSASTSERWMNCPGSIRLTRSMLTSGVALPPPSLWAQRGTAMHLAASGMLAAGGAEPDWSGEFAGIVLDDDEIDAVKLYVTVVLEDLREFGGELLIERRFNLTSLREGMFGTCDAVIIKCRDHVLRVYDFKGGVGVVVEVVNNSQAMYYGYGAMLSGKTGPLDKLELIIVQPRARHPEGPIRRWVVDVIDAVDWAQDLLLAAERTDDPEAPLHAGPWCQFCPAKGMCLEHARYVLEGAQLAFSTPQAEFMDPALFTNDEIAERLPFFPALRQWMDAMEAYAHAEAERGRPIKGYKLIARRSKRRWLEDERHVIAALHELGLTDDQIFNVKLGSPAQVEKHLPRAERDRLKELYGRTSPGTALVPESDSHEAVAASGLSVFTPLPEGDAA